MSEIISNRYVEDRMTDKFISILYLDIKENSAAGNGVEPIEIWKKLGYTAFHENVVPLILNKLIKNNIDRKFIKFDKINNRVYLTDEGKTWAIDNYHKY